MQQVFSEIVGLVVHGGVLARLHDQFRLLMEPIPGVLVRIPVALMMRSRGVAVGAFMARTGSQGPVR